MDNNFELVICIDKLGTKKITLEKNTLEEIDKITTVFENSDELRSCYWEKEDEFEKKYKYYMQKLTEKNSRREKGDIAIIGTINKEKNRVKVLYNKHIEVFEKKLIKNIEFEQYLRKNYYAEYCIIQQLKKEKITFTEEISWLVRKICKIYKQYSKDNNKPSIDTLYNEIKKEKQMNNKFNEINDKEETIDPEKYETYEIDSYNERIDNLKYDFRDNEEKQKKLVRKK